MWKRGTWPSWEIIHANHTNWLSGLLVLLLYYKEETLDELKQDTWWQLRRERTAVTQKLSSIKWHWTWTTLIIIFQLRILKNLSATSQPYIQVSYYALDNASSLHSLFLSTAYVHSNNNDETSRMWVCVYVSVYMSVNSSGSLSNYLCSVIREVKSVSSSPESRAEHGTANCGKNTDGRALSSMWFKLFVHALTNVHSRLLNEKHPLTSSDS